MFYAVFLEGSMKIMKMKIGGFDFNKMLRLVCCFLVLFPNYVLAASIPGFNGTVSTVIPKLATVVPTLPNKGGPPVNIPGFYGGTVGSPPQNQLPVLKYPSASIPGVSSIDTDASQNKETIHQTQPKVVIDWASFDIGANAWVDFEQQGNSSWAALNRIWDKDPTYIFGKLTAPGRIYLINQNGILFGPGSKVNVGSLVASALNISNTNFLNNLLQFKHENYRLADDPNAILDPLATVSNFGEINTSDNGSVFLLSPRVENGGSINAPLGQIGLVAGTGVQLLPPDQSDTSRLGYYYILVDQSGYANPPSSTTDPGQTFGKAVNWQGGNLCGDGGMVGMYGNNVENWGIIRSTTAFKNKKGQVELKAANKVTTGPNSIISLPVDDSIDPETGQVRTVSDTFDIQPTVFIGGLDQLLNGSIVSYRTSNQIELGGGITAPSGDVTLMAFERVYVGDGSSIDVSGVVTNLPPSILAGLKLTSVELRDDYAQKQGVIPGLKISTPIISGSTIGDLSAAILAQDRTALERSIGGSIRKYTDSLDGKDVWVYQPQVGKINISATGGDIIIKQGASLDFSGGQINYASGFVNTTKLLSGNKIYDISNAPLNLHYDAVLRNYTKTYERFGVQETYTGLYYGGAIPLKTYVDGYTVGGDAGQLLLTAPTIVLDGRLNGGVIQGTYQNTRTMQGSFSNIDDYNVALMLSKARGLETPRAGTVTIGRSQGTGDGNPMSISIVSETKPLPESFTSSASLPPNSPTEISAAILNNANLSSLNFNANLTISTAQDVRLNLQPGGAFGAQARKIDHGGEVKVPGGSISLITAQNYTSTPFFYGGSSADTGLGIPIPGGLPEGIYLGSRSRLDASGERIDNTLAGMRNNRIIASGQTTGGSISIKDETEGGLGVSVQAGAVVDVSGGYIIDQKRNITRGNAGVLSIQGSNIMLAGDLRGYALADPNGKIMGGSITLASNEIHVFDHTSTVKDPVARAFYLADNRFDDTGFTQVALKSINDLVIGENAHISTSLVKLNNPTPGLQAGFVTPGLGASIGSDVRPDLMHLRDSIAFMAGPSSFTANAGIAFDGSAPHYTGNLRQNTGINEKIEILSGAVVGTAPAGASVTRIANDVSVNPAPVRTQISLSAPNVEVAGTLLSPGGNITVAATVGNLSVESGANILAYGYNRPDPASTPKGFSINYQPVSGGSVVLSASSNLNLASEMLIDISGSDVIENRLLSADGAIVTFRNAGNPGSLSLTYGGNLNGTLQSIVDAHHANIAGIQGAALAISRINTDSGLDVKAADIKEYIGMGFDALTFRSKNSLIFGDPINVTIGRKLTLDAPVMQGGAQDVALSAPWIVLTNTYYPQPSSTTPVTSGPGFILSGQWIDVIGAVSFSGFQNVSLKAAQDIRLSEALYSLNDPDNNLGKTLATNGNLILDADRIYTSNFYSYASGSKIYPNIYSDYILHSDRKVTIQHTDGEGKPIAQHSDEPIYSAGGSLTVEGLQGIDVENGYLAAPLGSITLTTAVNGNNPAPQSRIYLGAGSVLTTAGSTAVSYGGIDSNNVWVTQDKGSHNNLTIGLDADSTKLVSQDSLPQKSVTLNAGEVIAMKGSLIDVSGGGSVFAYKFQPGIQGSIDPLTKANRYIVFKDNGFQMPGQAVYLEGGGGLSAGMYTLLPLDANNPQNARYAFMPGAYILELQSGATLPGQKSLSGDGYPLTVGYSAVAGTSILGTQPKIYSVRTAAEVLTTEGSYVSHSLTSGDGGNIGIVGSTVILGGSLKGAALQSYTGGNINLSAANIYVQSSATSALPEGFGFGTSFDLTPGLLALKNKLTLSADSVSGKGFKEVSLGDKDSTSTVTIESGTADVPTALEASIISLAAKNGITVNQYAQLNALTTKGKDSGEGVINLTTPGILSVDQGSIVHATHNISLAVNNVDHIQGNLQVDKSAITLKNTEIFFGERGSSTVPGLYVTKDMLNNKFSKYQDITFASKSDIQFLEDTALSSGSSLTLDASRILDMNTNGSSVVTLNSSTVNLRNSGATSLTTSGNTGTFNVNASNQINIGSGDVLFGGFKGVNLNSQNDLTLIGKGSLTTGNADLTISAARVTTASSSNTITNADGTTTTSVTAPNFTVNAGSGAIKMTSVLGVSPAASPVPGGLLEIDARRIELATVVQSDGGTIKLVTKGVSGMSDDGIFLHDGGQILARGTDASPGGYVTLATDYVDASGIVQSGRIALETGAKIDVSAGAQGDAGFISLSAPIGGVTLDGIIVGAALGNGKGGSFILDTNTIGDITPWNSKLIATTDGQGNVISGGFTETIDIRARQGYIDIAAGQIVTARNITMTADGGDINVSGTINSSTPNGGGQVRLYAQNNLNVNSGGLIKAQGTDAGAKGGDVLLNSNSSIGSVNLGAGGMVDVSGGVGGAGGTVYLRAQRNSSNDDMNVSIAQGSINGASAVYAEAVKSYDISSLANTVLPTVAGSTWLSDATAFYNSNQTVSRLGSVVTKFHLLPGIELYSSGDINWNAGWDLSGSRFGTTATTAGEPGVLTLRAGGNLNINNNLTDAPTYAASGNPVTSAPSGRNSWGFNLVAGADTSSADYLAVIKGKTDSQGNPVGNLTIANQNVVYTESAPIRFASGGNTVMGSGTAAGYMINPTMSYNLASYDGPIEGNVGRDLIINGGAIQTATGDINIRVNRDLQLNKDPGNILGAIRTTGQLSSIAPYPTVLDPLGRTVTQSDANGTFYWSYNNGGNITLDVGRFAGALTSGQWMTAQDNNAWDSFSQIRVTGLGGTRSYGIFSASYARFGTDKPTEGLATMGGGSLSVRTGGDLLAQAGTFGTGNLTVYSGGDIRGRFVNENGLGELHAMGNFGSVNDRQQIELLDSKMNVTAMGEIQIGAVLNPSLASDKLDAYRNTSFVYSTYTPDTSISLKAGTDVTIAGKSPIYKSGSSANNSKRLPNEKVLPPNVTVDAGANIFLLNDFTLTSSPKGNLSLQAGGDITGNYIDPTGKIRPGKILMSDIVLESWYGLFYIGSSGSEQQGQWIGRRTDNGGTDNNHGIYNPINNTWTLIDPVHQGDGQAVEIHAVGDIKNLSLVLPKKAEVSAGKDILDITYEGQNIDPRDVSKIQAGGNISMQYAKASSTSTSTTTDGQPHNGLIQGGPGVFLVQAGGSIDLGSLQDGIQAVGNGSNPVLKADKSSLIVVSGYTFDKSAADVGGFFTTIQKAGDDYAQLMAGGRLSDAAALLDQTREGTIIPFLGVPSGAGDINMTSSQISTTIGQSDIFVVANGSLNLGKTALPLSSGTVSNKTGITTAGGGAINIFAEKDVNVNESRIMTFYGGDITVWTDQGSINAGRGSRTAVSASPPRQIVTNGATVLVFSPPAIGSGIRAVTYGENAPEPGNIHLFAPTGVIDAGEAEIVGGKVTLAATQVLNSQNISFSVGSVGVPAASAGQAAGGLGALSGTTASLAETSKMTEQAAALTPAKAEAAKAMEDFVAKWVNVEVIGFGTEGE